jgi:DNA-binding response OmpR family regulator
MIDEKGDDEDSHSFGQGGGEPGTEIPTVLVVDDDAHLVRLYESWLEGDYDVETAAGGSEALEVVSDRIDVILLDRRMPGTSGDEVLRTIRDRDISCRVVMITGVTPDVDIVDMAFDDYLVKPVERSEVAETVDTALKRSAYDDSVQESYALAAKKAALEANMTSSELEVSGEYQDLVRRLDDVSADLQRTHDDLVREGARAVIFKDVLQKPTQSK